MLLQPQSGVEGPWALGLYAMLAGLYMLNLSKREHEKVLGPRQLKPRPLPEKTQDLPLVTVRTCSHLVDPMADGANLEIKEEKIDVETVKPFAVDPYFIRDRLFY